MKWFIKCLKNYVNFTDRAQRAEYWYFVLFQAITLIVATCVDYAIFGKPNSWIYSIAMLFFFLPSLAVSVRRLHDIGRSGTQILLYYILTIVWIVLLVVTGAAILAVLAGGLDGAWGFLAIAGIGGVGLFVWSIFFLVWFCTKGTDGDNKYGADPLK